MQIHGFSDASGRAMAAVVYTRILYTNGRIDIKLMASKTKLASTYKKADNSMFRADQSNIISKVGKFVVDYPRVECGNILWDQNWKQYVQHRVNEIRDLSSVESWRFCPGSKPSRFSFSRYICQGSFERTNLIKWTRILRKNRRRVAPMSRY